MNRFFASRSASTDIDELAKYLRALPASAARKIGNQVQTTFDQLAVHPAIGRVDEDLTNIAGEEVRRYCIGDYIFIYAAARRPIQFFGVLHGKRDVKSIMQRRLR